MIHIAVALFVLFLAAVAGNNKRSSRIPPTFPFSSGALRTRPARVNHCTERVTTYNPYGVYNDPQAASQSNPMPVTKWFRIEEVYPTE